MWRININRRRSGTSGSQGYEPSEIQAIASVDAFYVGSRYPLDSIVPSTFNETTAKSAIEKVDSIFTWFLMRINFDSE